MACVCGSVLIAALPMIAFRNLWPRVDYIINHLVDPFSSWCLLLAHRSIVAASKSIRDTLVSRTARQLAPSQLLNGQ